MIYYRSLEQVSRAVRQRIERMADELCQRYAWAAGACEPITFHTFPAARQPIGNAELSGHSMVQHGRSRTRPGRSGVPCLPVGDVPQLISVLCELSATWNLTWELRWEADGEAVGRIDDGRCDPGVFDHILSELNADRADEWRAAAESPSDNDEPESVPISRNKQSGEGGMRLADLLVDTWTGADLSKLSIQIAELEPRASSPAPVPDQEDGEDDDRLTDGPATLPFPVR